MILKDKFRNSFIFILFAKYKTDKKSLITSGYMSEILKNKYVLL